MGVIQTVDEALNLNGTLLSTKTSNLDTTLMDRLSIDAVLASGTWATAELKLYVSTDTDGDNWILASPALTLDAASRTWDVDVEDFTWARLQLTTAEGGVGTADITMTAGVFGAGAWGESVDLDDVNVVGDVMDVSTFASWTGILHAPTMATCNLLLMKSVDGIEWDVLSPAATYVSNEQVIQVDVRGIRLLRVLVLVAEGGALIGQLNSYADVDFPDTLSSNDTDWDPSVAIIAPWTTISGYDGFSYRRIGSIVELRGTMDHGVAWSFPESLFTLPPRFRPINKKRLQAMCEGSTGAGGTTAIVEIFTTGAIKFDSTSTVSNGSGWLSLDGLQFDIS